MMKYKSWDNWTVLSLYYKSTTVSGSEDYVLYDFNSIVGIVGGSMGLFLGFSCYQFGTWLIRKTTNAE